MIGLQLATVSISTSIPNSSMKNYLYTDKEQNSTDCGLNRVCRRPTAELSVNVRDCSALVFQALDRKSMLILANDMANMIALESAGSAKPDGNIAWIFWNELQSEILKTGSTACRALAG